MSNVGKSRRLDVPELLWEVRNGNGSAADNLMSVVYSDLRRIVRGVLVSEGRKHALRPAAVANESFVGLVESRCRSASTKKSGLLVDWQCRAHFLSLAARQMRLVLTDYGHRWTADKGGMRLTISMGDAASPSGTGIFDFETIDQLLRTSLTRHASEVRVLEMSWFGGMSDREIALVEHTSPTKARRDIEAARHWVMDMLRLEVHGKSGKGLPG
jgi:RNA polymerase sigma factor (TIGR02999 family)